LRTVDVFSVPCSLRGSLVFYVEALHVTEKHWKIL